MKEPYTVAEAIELLSACDPNALLTRTKITTDNMEVFYGLRGIEDQGPTVRLHFFGEVDE